MISSLANRAGPGAIGLVASLPIPLVGMSTTAILILRHLAGTLTCESGERGRRAVDGESGRRDDLLPAVTRGSRGQGSERGCLVTTAGPHPPLPGLLSPPSDICSLL